MEYTLATCPFFRDHLRGISTAAIVERVNAGETEEEIAKDYGLDYEEVKEALVYEQAA